MWRGWPPSPNANPHMKQKHGDLDGSLVSGPHFEKRGQYNTTNEPFESAQRQAILEGPSKLRIVNDRASVVQLCGGICTNPGRDRCSSVGETVANLVRGLERVSDVARLHAAVGHRAQVSGSEEGPVKPVSQSRNEPVPGRTKS